MGGRHRRGRRCARAPPADRRRRPQHASRLLHDGRIAYLSDLRRLAAVGVADARATGPAAHRSWPAWKLRDPQWAADGSRVPVGRGPMAARTLAWVDVATRRVTDRCRDDGMRQPRLSPDGGELGVSRDRPRRRDERVDSAAWRPAVQLAADTQAVSYPEWSPMARRSRWNQARRSDAIGVVARDGRTITQLTVERGQSWPHS